MLITKAQAVGLPAVCDTNSALYFVLLATDGGSLYNAPNIIAPQKMLLISLDTNSAMLPSPKPSQHWFMEIFVASIVKLQCCTIRLYYFYYSAIFWGSLSNVNKYMKRYSWPCTYFCDLNCTDLQYTYEYLSRLCFCTTHLFSRGRRRRKKGLELLGSGSMVFFPLQHAGISASYTTQHNR